MDHDLYPFRTLDDAPVFVWPGGARIALTVTVMLEARALAPAPDSHRDRRIVSPLGDFSPDWLTWSQHEYGNRVGIFRVLDVLDRFAIVPNAALGAAAAERYPELVDAFLRRGACFLAHGSHATTRITSHMDAAEEAAFIAASRDAVTKATGSTPLGWCGQDFNQTLRTHALLAEAGFTYTTDWSNDDRPYRLGSLISLPAHSEWNDLEAMWLRRVPAPDWAHSVSTAFGYLRDEGGGVFHLVLHPWIIGQASRIRYLTQALESMLGQPGIWRAGADALARQAATQI